MKNFYNSLHKWFLGFVVFSYLVYEWLILSTTIGIVHTAPLQSLGIGDYSRSHFTSTTVLRNLTGRPDATFGLTYGNPSLAAANQVNTILPEPFIPGVLPFIFLYLILGLIVVSLGRGCYSRFNLSHKSTAVLFEILGFFMHGFIAILSFSLISHVGSPDFIYWGPPSVKMSFTEALLSGEVKIHFIWLILIQSTLAGMILAVWTFPLIPYENNMLLRLHLQNWRSILSWSITSIGGIGLVVIIAFVFEITRFANQLVIHFVVLFGGAVAFIALYGIYKMMAIEEKIGEMSSSESDTGTCG